MPITSMCLKCKWTVMDGVQALILPNDSGNCSLFGTEMTILWLLSTSSEFNTDKRSYHTNERLSAWVCDDIEAISFACLQNRLHPWHINVTTAWTNLSKGIIQSYTEIRIILTIILHVDGGPKCMTQTTVGKLGQSQPRQLIAITQHTWHRYYSNSETCIPIQKYQIIIWKKHICLLFKAPVGYNVEVTCRLKGASLATNKSWHS